MALLDFGLFRQPRVFFGEGKLFQLPALIGEFGSKVLLVTGAKSFRQSEDFSLLLERLSTESFWFRQYTVSGEPSPEIVDHAVADYGNTGIDVVVAIGGGSVIDAGKAISAMLLKKEPVELYIEGLPGYRAHDGSKVPFIAVPTTSGTGSEATNNAVISKVGRSGYKRSLRHPAFIPEAVLIDPKLMLDMPGWLTVSSGMDALTQLIEAFVSPFGSPYVDAVALSGLEYFSRSFIPACQAETRDIDARSGMAYAALMSGIALVNAGLGIVHGFASSIGGFVDIPHGVLCATLLGSATMENMVQLREKGCDTNRFLAKYAQVGRVLCSDPSMDDEESCFALLKKLDAWENELKFPKLGEYGVEEKDIDGIVSRTRNKSNPVELDDESMKKILKQRL